MNVSNSDLGYVDLIREKMKDHNFMFCYKGSFSQHIVKSILNITEKKLLGENVDMAIKKKVFHVMVECLQSICKPNRDKEYARSSLIMIGKVNDDYVVYSGNVVSTINVNRLQESLDGINKLSKEELKKKQYELLSTVTIGELGDNSIGLIDIAKRSGNKLAFEFLKINEQNSYFVLKTSINSL